MDRRTAIKALAASSAGLALSAAFTSALTSCKAVYVPDYKPRVLTASQDRLLAELVEIIIPTTDTPGAKAAGVHQYIDTVLARLKDEPERIQFLDTLNQLGKQGFLKQSKEDQESILRSLERDSKNDTNPFFAELKAMTIFGYYTSKIGASEELKYVHMAGYYDGDIPVSQIGKNYY